MLPKYHIMLAFKSRFEGLLAKRKQVRVFRTYRPIGGGQSPLGHTRPEDVTAWFDASCRIGAIFATA
jgi:hypothetical protein